MNIYDLNATVIYKNNLDYNFSHDQYAFLDNLPISQSELSDEMYLLNKKLFLPLQGKVYEHITDYTNNVCGFSQDMSLKITESWYRETKPGNNHGKHNHPNSLLSGIIYVNVPEECSEHSGVNFETMHHTFKNFSFEYDIETPNKYNCRRTFVPVKSGDIVLFPSWIDHYVSENKSSVSSRKIISFNTFLKGKLEINNKYPNTLFL